MNSNVVLKEEKYLEKMPFLSQKEIELHKIKVKNQEQILASIIS